jgi:hypothetical protein
MTTKDLPRPWILAALADVPIDELTRQDGPEADQDQRADRRTDQLPRPDERRRRLAAWRCDRRGHRALADLLN